MPWQEDRHQASIYENTEHLGDQILVAQAVITENNTVKPVLSGHLKLDKTNVLMENGSLMKVKSIAECSTGAFCNTFDLH